MKHIFSALIGLGIILSSTSFVSASSLVWNDKDAHKCIWSAGYRYSENLWKCIRPWELYTIKNNSVSTGNKRLDAMITQKIGKITQSFQKDAEWLIRELWLTGTTGYELQIDTTLVQTGNTISALVETYSYLGWAHGQSLNYTWNYDGKKNKLLFLSNIVSRKELGVISKNIENFLIQELWDNIDIDWIREGLSVKKLSNFGIFTLQTDDSGRPQFIEFHFADYQVGPHAIGMPVVKIRLGTLDIVK